MARPRVAIHAVGDVTKQSSPARQLVPPRADVTSMRAVRTNAIRSRLSALLRFLGFPCRAVRDCGLDGEQCPGRGRAPGPAPDPVFARPSDRCRSRAVRDGHRRRPVRRGSAGGHDQHRQRIVGCDCARRGRHQRFRPGRHQRVDAVSRQGQAGRPQDQGGVRAVQQGALFHHRPQEPRRPRADRHRGQDSRRRRRRPVDPAVAGGGKAERHQASRA